MIFSTPISTGLSRGRTSLAPAAAIVGLEDVTARPRRVAVGKFDGLHLGHRAVVAGCDTVCTFDPHPLAVLDPHGAPPLLTSIERRAELAGGLGVEELVVLPFDAELRTLSPHEFVSEILLERLAATHVHVGENFRYGHRAVGTASLLAADRRLDCRVVSRVTVGGASVSSTRVRALIAAGALSEARGLLGAPHALRCTPVYTEAAAAGLLTLSPPPGLAVPPSASYACRLYPAGAPRSAVSRDVVVFGEGDDATILARGITDRSPGDDVVVEFLSRNPRPRRVVMRPAQPAGSD